MGVVVAGCRIEATVGRGGMGVVYRARQLDLDRDVALKLIAPEHVEDPDARARFLTEARAAAAVEHPHVVPVYAAGIEEGQAYLVMRYVPSDDLRTLVRIGGPLAAERAAAIAMDLGGALDAIHRAGYVHRDVKPANVLIDVDGHVYLSDFGLAKHALASTGPTRSDHWVGTVDFAAPEQIRGEAVDARTDVYALGGVLFFMLTGRVPFERESDPAKLWAHLTDDPPRPSSLRPGLPARMDEAVLRALAKDPADRFPSAGDLCRAAVGDSTSPERTVARGAAAPGGAGPLDGSDTWTRSPAPGRRRRSWLAVPIAVLAAGALLVLVLVLVQDDDHPRAESPPPTATPGPAGPEIGAKIRSVARTPRDVDVAGGDVWVLSPDSARIDRIDPRTGTHTGVQPRIGRGGWSMAPDGKALWVTHPNEGTVQRIDAVTGKVTAPIVPTADPVQVVADRGGVWVAVRQIPLSERASMPDTPDLLQRYERSGRLRYEVPVPKGIRALAVGGGFVWVSVIDETVVQQRSADGRRRRRRVTVPEMANHLAYGAGALWASLPEHDSVARIDPRIGLDVTEGVRAKPAGLAVLGKRVYVASNTEHAVELLDVKTGRRTGDGLPVPANPYGVAAGSGHVWVTGRRGVLTRIDP